METTLPVGEIAARVGYEDPLYFSRRFRQVAGTKATEYRASHTNALSLDEDARSPRPGR